VTLTRTAIYGPSAERLQLSLQKSYRLSAHLLALLMALGKPFDLPPLRSLFALLAGSLSPNVYIMIPLVQQMETEKAKEGLDAKRLKNAKGRVHVVAQKVTRESKLLPALIFNIELFDRQILEIQRKAGITLVDQIHRSTARDFRIQTEELEEALQNFKLQAIASDADEDEEVGSELPNTALAPTESEE